MTQRVVDGLPGPSVPWLWPFCLHPNPHTECGGAAQGKPRDHAQPSLQFLAVIMWLPHESWSPLSNYLCQLREANGIWWLLVAQ